MTASAEPALYAQPLYDGAFRVERRVLPGAKSVSLRTALFTPEHPRGSVVVNTGRTEFIEKYAEVIGDLLRRDLVVLTHDWRGQGLSGRLIPDHPLRGHADGAETFLHDLQVVLNAYTLPKPRLAVGHSMGAALTLLAVLETPVSFDGVVLTSPMLGVNTGLWGPAAKLISEGLAGIGLDQAVVGHESGPWADVFDGNPVTHSLSRWTRAHELLVAHHDLALDGVTWGWLRFAIETADRIVGHPHAPQLSTPLRIVAAGDERLADLAATRTFCARVPQASSRLDVVEGGLHELLMEEDALRNRFWAAFDEIVAQLRA